MSELHPLDVYLLCGCYFRHLYIVIATAFIIVSSLMGVNSAFIGILIFIKITVLCLTLIFFKHIISVFRYLPKIQGRQLSWQRVLRQRSPNVHSWAHSKAFTRFVVCVQCITCENFLFY